MALNPDDELAARDALSGELMPGETILWAGKPDPKVHFCKADIFLIPFSLMWGGFALTFFFTMLLGIAKGADTFGLIFSIPFGLVGLYFIFGRFIYKSWKKKRTFYAVTDKRVLAQTGGKSMSAAYLRNIPVLNKSVGRNGVGTITFGNSTGYAGWYGNNGMDFMAVGHGELALAFYDIREADKVYELVNRLRGEAAAQ